jgi:cyclophilin family peptidyl-prolyl cis-trans isomerase
LPVPKSTHDKQVARAREKRKQDALARRAKRSRLLVFGLVVLLVLALVGAALVGLVGDGGTPTVDDDPDAATDAGEEPGEDGEEPLAADERPADACPPTPDDVPEVTSEMYDEPPPMEIDVEAAYVATVATTCGDIVFELDAAGTPTTVNNFVFLAEEGYYDGVGFHRVIEGFVVQAGDPAGTGCGREDCISATGPAFPGYTFEDELEPATELVADEGGYPQGALAMANAGPDTNGSQFFIVEPEDGAPLPPAYTYFGRVLEGQDVVQRIALGPAGGEGNALDPVIITSVTIEAG